MSFTPGSGAVISFVVNGAQVAQRQIEGMGGSFEKLSSAATNSLKGLAAFAGIGLTLGALTEQVMSAQREFDKINASLVTATGSTANASEAFKALQAFAATTPYSVAEATEAFIKMRNLGLDPSEKALRSYGNTSAAMGKDLNQMVEAVADAATGEFERLKEFGIKAKQNGDEVSLTFQGVTQKIGNNAKEIEGYLQNIGETNFGGSMEARAATLDGALSNLGDAWESTMRTIAQNGIGEAMQSGIMAVASSLSDLNAILDAVAGSARKEGEAIKEASVLHTALTTIFEANAVLGTNVVYVFTQIGKDLYALAAVANAVAHGDLELAKKLSLDRKAEAEQARKDVDAKSEAILGAAAKAKKAAEEEAAARKKSGKDVLGQYKTVQTAAEQAAAAADKHADAMKKYATAPEQLAAELKKLKSELGTTFTAEDEARVRKHFASMDEGAKKSAAATEKEKEAYVSLSTSIREKIDQNSIELETGEAATESQKLQIKLTNDLASGKLKLSGAHLAVVQAMLSQLAVTEDLLKMQQSDKDGMDWMQQSAQVRNASTASLEAEYALYGKTADARDIAMVAVKAEADLEAFLAAQRLKGVAIGEEMEAQLRAEKDMRVGVEQATLAQAKALGYANQLAEENKRFAAESISDPRAREQALLQIDADVWRERIRLAGEGTAAQKLLQQEFDTWYANRAKAAVVNVDLTQATTMLDAMSALDEAAQSAAQGMVDSFGRVGSAIGSLTTALSGYGKTQAAIAAQLAAATLDAKGDKTKIERANMMAAEASAQAQVKSYGDMANAAKGFFKENSTGYKVLGGIEKAYRAAEMAMALESMAKKIFFKETEVAANMSLNATKLAGETATTAASTGLAATESSAWGITAVIKAIASLPFPLNLAAGAATLAAVVAVGAKIAGGLGGAGGVAVNPNSAEERQKVQGTGTVLGDSSARSASMANSLEIMKKNSELELDYQNSMLTALQNIATALGGAAKGIIQTTGITSGSAFGTVASSDKALIGASHTKDITDSGVQFFGTFGQLRNGGGTGRQYEDVYTTSDGGMFRSGWTRTDTNYKALSAEAMKPFALIFDNMGDLLVDAGAKLGQDSTSLTNAINNISVDFGVSLRGLSGQDLTDALNAGVSVAFDKVTTQLFPTIQQFQKMGEGLGETLVRVASDVQGVDSVFASMGKSVVGMSIEAKERLVEAFGGLDQFATLSKSFMQNFYSEAEQRDATKAKLNPVLSQYGLSTEGPDAQKMFREFVQGLDTSTAAGSATAAMLMKLQQAFFDVTDAVASERKDLLDQLDEVMMTEVQLREKERNALDASNRALYDQVQAAKKVKDAQDAAKTSLGNFINQMKSFSQTAAGLNNSLLLGDKSTLTPEQQYEEARRQFLETRKKAYEGDATAQGNLQSVENAFLEISRQINGGDSRYSSDLASVLKTNEDLSKWATGSVNVAQASLNALTDSSKTLTEISATLTAIAKGGVLAPVQTSATAPVTYAAPIDYSRMGTLDMAALVAKIKELTDEVKALRKDQQKQTGDIITGAAKAADAAADKVVDGVHEAVTDGAYAVEKSERKPK